MSSPALRFNGRARDYAAGRPSYPPAVLTALFEGLPEPTMLTVVDLGAGTGISARLLAAHAGQVFAIEPNADMAASGQAGAGPNERLQWRAARAEETGLPSSSAELVTAFQAFHWFDAPAALREIARILKPGCRAALVYNERHESDAFTAAYGALVRRHATDETERRRSDGRATFAAYPRWQRVATLVFDNVHQLDRPELHARARSTSYLPASGEAADVLHRALDVCFDAHACNGIVAMRMKTSVTLAELEVTGAPHASVAATNGRSS